MDADGNPALPLWFDLAWMAGIVLWLLLVGVAWVSVLGATRLVGDPRSGGVRSS